MQKHDDSHGFAFIQKQIFSFLMITSQFKPRSKHLYFFQNKRL